MGDEGEADRKGDKVLALVTLQAVGPGLGSISPAPQAHWGGGGGWGGDVGVQGPRPRHPSPPHLTATNPSVPPTAHHLLAPCVSTF